MSRQSEGVKRWRNNTKKKLIIALGGKCAICGYKDCDEAMELHHIDPSKKELSFGYTTRNPVAWSNIVIEAKKCVLLCCRCHREFHAGFRELPEIYPAFNESLLESEESVQYNCPICGKQQNSRATYCSKECVSESRYRRNWQGIDLELILKENGYNFSSASRQLGISDNGIRKRAKKLGLI